MRAVCSGTDGIGCCGWSDMAKPPEITAPTPLSTFRLTHSPTVSAPFTHERRVAKQRLLDREDVEPRHVGSRFAAFEHEKLDTGASRHTESSAACSGPSNAIRESLLAGRFTSVMDRGRPAGIRQ